MTRLSDSQKQGRREDLKAGPWSGECHHMHYNPREHVGGH